ncbi:MAG: hypothetical protein CR982_05795 [Candidatus Cloacimonadota bacterium]|nr:MAG: hypothetical protein CR982_05795 [Candidatus Cloacimonadota bacterium]PIE81366.1 MAG: hypothetical protein CSA15_00575 [Candidatus Delongbacteria bacterium]
MIKKLVWDSEFFSMKIGDFDASSRFQVEEEHMFDLIQSSVDISYIDRISMLEYLDFKFVELNITFYKNLTKSIKQKIKLDPNLRIRKADISDIETLQNFTKIIYKKSRYNHKPFSKHDSEKLYSTWIKKAVLGTFDDFCLVLSQDKNICSFITVKIEKDIATIGLVGSNPKFSNKGFASILINMLMEKLIENDVAKLFVSTQGTNIKAQNFYIRNGFKVNSVSFWYYKVIE